MSGKDGSTWTHEWVPTNAVARRLKEGSYPGRRKTPLRKHTPSATAKKPRRYYVVRSLGGHLFEIGDRERGGTVRKAIRTRAEATAIARRMNREGGYAT